MIFEFSVLTASKTDYFHTNSKTIIALFTTLLLTPFKQIPVDYVVHNNRLNFLKK